MSYISPTTIDTFKSHLPEAVLGNELLLKFIEYYYTWLSSENSPGEFSDKMHLLMDIDWTTPVFKDKIISSLLKIIPEKTIANKALLAKHLTDFLRAKGTEDSFNYIMKAIYGSSVELEFNRNKLFNASDNEYTYKTSIAINVEESDWNLAEGSTLIQTTPYATATINSAVLTSPHTVILNLNSNSLTGEFIAGASVKVLKNDVNRNYFSIEEYSTLISKNGAVLTFKPDVESVIPYENLVVRQLNSDFRAVVHAFISNINGVVKVLIKDEVGTLLNEASNELYFVSSSIEDKLILKNQYYYGVVSPAIVDLDIIYPGALYKTSTPVSFIGSSGTQIGAHISEVKSGGIQEVHIVSKGFGYSVGDELQSTNELTGNGFKAKVSAIDGIGGDIKLISELNSIQVVSGGTGYAVGDILRVEGGVTDGLSPIRLTVATINSTREITGITLISGGYGYPQNSKLEVVNLDTGSKISGLISNVSIINGEIKEVLVSAYPSISTDNVGITINGYGATGTATVIENQVTSISVDTGGFNYLNPTIRIVRNVADTPGLDATATVEKDANGTITNIIVQSQGSNYTIVPTVIIEEKFGVGGVIVPTIIQQSLSKGEITSLTITDRGNYSTLPSCCFSTKLKTLTGTGSGATANLEFKVKSAKIANEGKFYSAISYSIDGNGTGARLLPIAEGGIITRVIVLDGGKNYPYNTTLSIPNSGGTPAVFTLNNINGSIVDVDVVSGGTLYTDPELEPQNIILTGSIACELDISLSGTGTIEGVSVENGGFGYLSQSEIPPISISVSGGTGALLIPTISNGKIESITVQNGGRGYTSTDIVSITGGGGTGASARIVVHNGIIIGVNVLKKGSSYRYGTQLLVYGDGVGAVLTPVVETGITSLDIISSGHSFVGTPTVAVNDPAGTGAIVEAVIKNDKLVELILVEKGSGYISPTLSFSSGFDVVATANARRHISSVTVASPGTGYSSANIVVLGDGTGASFIAHSDNGGAISNVSIVNTGSGYTVSPTVTLSDTSNYGAVTSVNITSFGSGYKSVPIIYLPEKYDDFGSVIAGGTKFSAFGEDIGAVKKISFDYQNSNHETLPKPQFNVTAILYENVPFIKGEYVLIKNGKYNKEFDFEEYHLELENGVLLELENDNTFIDNLSNYGLEEYLNLSDAQYLEVHASENNPNFTDVKGKIEDVDYARNTVTISGIFPTLNILAGDFEVITEDNQMLVDEASGVLNESSIIYGSHSNGIATIRKLPWAFGSSIQGSIINTEPKFTNTVGLLNNALSVIPNNNKYQNKAYVVKTDIPLAKYEQVLRTTVHPAGFSLFGDVKFDTLNDMDVLNEIALNKNKVNFNVFSAPSLGLFDYQSRLNDVYGDFNKFKFSSYILDIVDFKWPSTSKYIMSHYIDYLGTTVSAGTTGWASTGNIEITQNFGVSPRGSKSSTKLLNKDVSSTSYISKTFEATIGNEYSLSLFLTKSTNSNFVEVLLGTTYIRINNETGEYTTNNSTKLEFKWLGDYWFVMISSVATTTSETMKISLDPTSGVEVSNVILKNITSGVAFNGYLRAINSTYVDIPLSILDSEAEITIS